MCFLSALIMIVCIESFYRQHTRRCDWEMFEGRKEFLDEVHRKRDKPGRRMMYERKQQMREKHLKQSPRWILGIIKRQLNLFKLCDNEMLDNIHRQDDMALVYQRKNHRQYPDEGVWDKYYFDLLCMTFESRHELWAWCEARERQLKFLVYLDEQHRQQMKAKEDKRLAQEAKQQRRRETPST